MFDSIIDNIDEEIDVNNLNLDNVRDLIAELKKQLKEYEDFERINNIKIQYYQKAKEQLVKLEKECNNVIENKIPKPKKTKKTNNNSKTSKSRFENINIERDK